MTRRGRDGLPPRVSPRSAAAARPEAADERCQLPRLVRTCRAASGTFGSGRACWHGPALRCRAEYLPASTGQRRQQGRPRRVAGVGAQEPRSPSMLRSPAKALAISGAVLAALGAVATSGSPEDRREPAASAASARSKSEATVSSSEARSATSGRSVGARASASSRAAATARRGAAVKECAADAVVVTEVDGRRVVVRRSERSADGQGPCSAEAHVETRSGNLQPDHN